MKTSEITELTTNEIIERINNSVVELTRMRLNHSVNPLDNSMKLKYARKDIARLKTELRKRQLEK
jgi:large subunit ribosomal protein L29